MPDWGGIGNSLWNSATSSYKSAASTVASGIDSAEAWAGDKTQQAAEAAQRGAEWAGDKAQQAVDATQRAVDWTADKAQQGADWTADKARQAVDWTAQKEQQAADWTIQKGKELGETAKADAAALARLAKEQPERIKQQFTGGPKAYWCVECTIKKKFPRPYAAYQGKQLRVCSTTSADGKTTTQTIEEVKRNPDTGTYEAIATVKPAASDSKTPDLWTSEPIEPRPVPTPTVSHVNGIDVTPTQGLKSALTLQGQIHSQCANKAGAGTPVGGGGGAGGGGGGCEGCDCLLFTYSEKLGMTGDIAQCLAAKSGWEGEVTNKEADMIRDAIKHDTHLTMSAHSRGSILTEDSWNQVFAEQAAAHYNSAEAVRAGDIAAMAASGGGLVASEVARAAAQQAVANQQAANILNSHVTVVSSGNAVAYYNPYEQGKRVVSTFAGKPMDLVNVGFGSAYSPYDQMKTVPAPLPEADKFLWLPIPGMHHSFDEHYAAPVAAQFCGPKPAKP